MFLAHTAGSLLDISRWGPDTSWNGRCSIAWRQRLQYHGVGISSIAWSSMLLLGWQLESVKQDIKWRVSILLLGWQCSFLSKGITFQFTIPIFGGMGRESRVRPFWAVLHVYRVRLHYISAIYLIHLTFYLNRVTVKWVGTFLERWGCTHSSKLHVYHL